MSAEKSPADLLVRGAASLATVAGPPGPLVGERAGAIGLVENASLACLGDRIVAVGRREDVEDKIDLAPSSRVIDARDKCVLPGFVDPHTHIVYAGDRADEYARRQAGATYAEILAAGGGILDTVRRTRAASDDELYDESLRRLQRMVATGTTTVEIKTGYGLDLETELRMLAVIRRLAETGPARVVPTLLAAHAVPPEYRERRQAYVDLVCEEIIPAAAEAKLAVFCDVFCEEGAFTLAESRRILETGLRHGLRAKLHADQLSAGGGARLAAELGAVSADHLDFADDDGLAALAQARVTAVLLPSAALILRHREHAPGRRFIAAGVPVALATDCNPGSSPVEAMPLVMSLACALQGLTPTEALVAATRNAACAVGLGDEVGSLEPGKRADFLIVDAPNPNHMPYRMGVDLVEAVFVAGRQVAAKRPLDRV